MVQEKQNNNYVSKVEHHITKLIPSIDDEVLTFILVALIVILSFVLVMFNKAESNMIENIFMFIVGGGIGSQMPTAAKRILQNNKKDDGTDTK